MIETKSIKSLSNLLYYAEACSEFAVPISASLRPGNTASSEKMLNGGEPLTALRQI